MSAEAKPEDEEEEEETTRLDDPEWLDEQYNEEGLTQAEIGELEGVTASTVSHYMSKHDVQTNSRGSLDERLDDPDWLREKYIDEELTMAEIAEEADCSDGTVMRRLHQHEIPVRRSARGKSEEDEDDESADDEE